MKISDLHSLFTESKGITTDTRDIVPGALFFAIKGENFDGNLFAENALALGAKYAIVEDENLPENPQFILVDDVLKTLQDLAKFHRLQFNIPVIGITGSNGKTTSKELMGTVLDQKYKVLVTKGNLNNHLGVPFTLLKLTAAHEIAIIEMGANKPGDIKELVEIACPNYGIITNIGKAHIEGFGSLENVVKTKMEMYDYIQANNGFIFYHAENEILKNALEPHTKTASYGAKSGDVVGALLKVSPFVHFKYQTGNYQSPAINTHLVGDYNFINFLLGVVVGTHFKVPFEAINLGLSNYKPSNNRSQITQTEKNTLVVDCYNANPLSMEVAIKSFNKIESDKKLLILGDMLELGPIQEAEHKAIILLVTALDLNAIYVGSIFKRLLPNAYQTVEEVIQGTDFSSYKDYTILLKGSRGIKLEGLIAQF
ncbi:UDP-N-acetylmuramoyl-tripeptide--D-alanyl-D-alanine ligase [Putridiphycobacter roseus]|uniref:UDP-N-acetylmuramoyl-tripeptide--D-alanyl-D-alanine ligase n=1 Tax=Putridiphycobacter roseus TaxID=2219161 RepID=A0A2W1MZS5_9FLAO|nr:UDP-N-acetylmuramoyl-tripeptide--D-alanyl-D-alanine ligase [Putridiphycobacter roseus]PZE16770.1 UDP-N-acetylmuramoyl-tripeptide--D-alanyl-D-alanine ligase [Putridiphycobacter roseus]